MIAELMTDKELRAAIREEKGKLSKRIQNIEKHPELPQYAVQRYRELEPNLPKNLRKVNGKELEKIYRQLRYISHLKTSRVEGARKAAKVFEPLKEEMSALSEKMQSNIWKTLESFLSSAPSAEKFKYEVLGQIIDMAYVGQTSREDVAAQLVNAFTEANLKLGNGNDEDLKLLFTEELKTLL